MATTKLSSNIQLCVRFVFPAKKKLGKIWRIMLDFSQRPPCRQFSVLLWSELKGDQCSGFPSLHPDCLKRANQAAETSTVVPKQYKAFLDSKKAEFNAAR